MSDISPIGTFGKGKAKRRSPGDFTGTCAVADYGNTVGCRESVQRDFVVGAAGSGKSESIAVPLLSEFVRLGYSGLVYDFKFPTLANDVESF